MALNKVMLIGNVGRDPEVRYLDGQNGNAKVATFTLATTERYRDRNGEMKENTEWHNIVVWRNLADIVEKYVAKGTQLYVEGRLRTRSWDDQSGNKRYTTEIQADTVQLLGRKSDNPATNGAAGNYHSPSAPGGNAPASNQQAASQPAGAPASSGFNTAPAAPAAPRAVDPTILNQTEELPDDDLPF